MKKTVTILLCLAAALVLLSAILMVKTYTYPFAKHGEATQRPGEAPQISEVSLRRLAGGIMILTVSSEVYGQTDFAPFDEFKRYLALSYPTVYEAMDTMSFNTYGLVFRWPGSDPSLKPLLMLSHYDVVPVDSYTGDIHGPEVFSPNDPQIPPVRETQVGWDYPPFSGAVVDGRIYGRGTLDMKSMLFSIMEAVEALISEGYTPRRDIWFAFGHDEEVSGQMGAATIAKYFSEKGIIFEGVYDEGGIITTAGTGGINRSLALVGTAEKGFLSLRIKVRGQGGHSSMPPAKSSLIMASEIMSRLNNGQMPLRLIAPIESFLDNVGSEMGFMSRMAIANKWLMRPMLLNALSKEPATNALVRTTTAVTMAKGSEAANVLASLAEIVVNFRLLPGDSVEDVVAHVENICSGYDTETEIISAREASSVSPYSDRHFDPVKKALAPHYPATIVTPYITIAGTDAYKYEIVSDHVYRFMPVYLNMFEQNTMHNDNEHITIENYARMIAYFKTFIQEFDSRE